jgi:hypothetical protein
MAGMRRRLRGITTRVSGALASPRDEGAAPAVEPGVSETGEVPVVTEPTPEPAAASTQPPEAAAVVEVDAVCAAAVELARATAVEAGGSTVGDHLGVEAEDALVVTHSFASTDKAYVGWRWAVTVVRAEGGDEVTVDEVVLLPGSGALVAPAWIPWDERVRPGDLAPGDLLPPKPDDPRLVPAYADLEAELAAETFWELGLGRPRVLSREGLEEAAERWYAGDRGPDSPMARQAPGLCLDCAFRVPLAGSLGSLFGVCANGLSPEDAKVVSLDHGCGAHSETEVDLTHRAGLSGMVVEDEELELVQVGPSPDDETPDGHAS